MVGANSCEDVENTYGAIVFTYAPVTIMCPFFRKNYVHVHPHGKDSPRMSERALRGAQLDK
jgi:hypothetical protein